MPRRSSERPSLSRGAVASLLAVLLAAPPVAAAPGASAPPAASDSASDPSPNEAVAAAAPAPAPTPSQDEAAERPDRAGMGANVVAADDPEAKRARAELEGASLNADPSAAPDRLPGLQRAAWWTLFGAFSLATAGGVLAGLAEVQEDRALRLASTIDLESGGQYTYADKQAEYQGLLDKGERYQWTARGLLLGGGLALGAAIALFAVDGARARKAGQLRARRLHFGAGGLEVAF